MLTWLEIDLSAITRNLAAIKLAAPKSQIMAVVKSNGYGHGLVEVARHLSKQGVGWFAVTTLADALTLKEAEIDGNILVLGYVEPAKLKYAVENDIRLTMYTIELLPHLEIAARKIGKKPKVHLKVETGLNRLGLETGEALALVKKLSWTITLEAVFTHFASSDGDRGYTARQLEHFERFVRSLGAAAPNVLRHAANSAAIFNLPESHLDMVRPGIALYGFLPTSAHRELKPALSWKAQIISVKKVKNGSKIGYGGTVKMLGDSKIAVVSAGYAEGYDRGLSNNGEMLVAGVRCPVVGRVAMSMTIVDVSRVPSEELFLGQEVVVVGKSGQEEITVLDLAQKIDTNVHEILTRLPADLPRRYI